MREQRSLLPQDVLRDGDSEVPFAELLAQVARSRTPAGGDATSDACRSGPSPDLPSSRRCEGVGVSFVPASSVGRLFEPNIGFLQPKPDLTQWEHDRIFVPERVWPCRGRADSPFIDRNSERKCRPDWKPTIANRRTGESFPLKQTTPTPRATSAVGSGIANNSDCFRNVQAHRCERGGRPRHPRRPHSARGTAFLLVPKAAQHRGERPTSRGVSLGPERMSPVNGMRSTA
eukprot:TRINITY_DN8835_c0_g1_i1.p2 TRINITY_DN8835_c0_g1~~TRINITY_DN8835_c0_g1_i1.p2  ORF type:complete len:231 (+),score=15.84 TRINITY_DN8835_c0_g1_i1:68-760(+)